MKIAIFSPNLTRNCGGAETYALGLANVLSKQNEIVFFAMHPHDHKFDINGIYEKYGSQCFETRYVNYLMTGGHEYLKELGYKQLRKKLDKMVGEFDLFINSAYGRLIAPNGIKSIHIIHFPDKSYKAVFPGKKGEQKRLEYLDSYDLFLCNSMFTSEWFKKIWGSSAKILNPPITMKQIEDGELQQKENIILAVDRLVPDKKVDVMIEAFIRLKEEEPNDYRLVIIGNTDSREIGYYNFLKKEINGHADIEIKTHVKSQELIQFYKKAKIFWHAKGYKVEDNNPLEMEHFGMTTVEAMTNGAVPIVINKAGQKEIVLHGENGYKWDTMDQLISFTKELIDNSQKMHQMQSKAIKSTEQYLMPEFKNKVDNYINSLFEGNTYA